MIEWLLHPAYQLFAAGLIAAVAGRRVGGAIAVLAPLIGIATLINLPDGFGLSAGLGPYTIQPLRVDRLGFVFALIFLIAAALSQIFALAENRRVLRGAGLIYAGAAVGGVLAGDLISLFIHWELTALASVMLVWDGQRKPDDAHLRAGLRYLLLQIISGLLLLIGAVMWIRSTGHARFEHIGFGAPGGLWFLLAFGLKCAFPLLHNWMHDAYPRASASGTVMLSAFTTKLAVYALARGFAGTDSLLWIGALMATLPIVLSLLENDLRRVLTYGLNSQQGFMVAGIGIGTPLAIDGASAYAFACVLYMALLFMATGAVLHRTGTTQASELGGLYRSMPLTTLFCIVGALSIAAFPLFSGFATKSMIVSAAAYEHELWLWLALLLASVGVLLHAGLRTPYAAFFGPRRSSAPVREAPWPMLVAMALTALLCIAIGVFPQPLYALLPHESSYKVFTADHLISQLQLLLFGSLAFVLALRVGLAPRSSRGVVLDSDWLYRRAAPAIWRVALSVWAGLMRLLGACARWLLRHGQKIFVESFSEQELGGVWSLTSGAALLLILLGVWLLQLL